MDKEVSPVKYVIMTLNGDYLVEYLIGELVFSSTVSRAMVFDDYQVALQFKRLIYGRFNIITSVHTYIY